MASRSWGSERTNLYGSTEVLLDIRRGLASRILSIVLSTRIPLPREQPTPASFKYTLLKGVNVAMPKVEINIPEHLEMQIAQMVEKGEFLNREEAIEDLLATGLKAYKTSGPTDEDEEPGFEEEDGMMGHDDEYVF